jgi:serine/threonine protein kinase/formylglycine-generating enzyme required for sulfatase activity
MSEAFPGASPMSRTPDDSIDDEAPETRALFPSEFEEVAGGMPADSEQTLEDETRRALPDTDSALARAADGLRGNWVQGPISDLGLHTGWSSGSGVPSGSGTGSRRGVVGKIAPGQTLYSKYQVLRRLGAGAMGEVWLVRHVILKSEHALKLIVPNFATNAVALMRFQREFEVMATLRHEHAVIIYDACIDEDGGYIDMEYVEGQTIHDVLGSARGRVGVDPSASLMPLDWIVRVLDQLCEVLEVAHHKGIVHRDLKPSNMMLLDGRPVGKEYLKVLDFGIAKVRDDPDAAGRDHDSAENRTEGFIGTPSYGSPEQALGTEVDGRADLYSVGIMLYEFVTGRLPFRGNHWQVMSQNASTPPPPFAQANPRLRPLPELEHAILRVLAKKPEDRPQTARQLYHEIRKAVEAVLPAGSPGLPPETWAASFQIPHSQAFDVLPPTQHELSIGELPSTEAATLIGKSTEPGWTDKAAIESPSDFGEAASLDETGTARKRNAAFIQMTLIALIALIACSGLVLFLSSLRNRDRTEAKGPTPEIAGADIRRANKASPGIVVDTGPPKETTDFYRYWPPTYQPVEGYEQDMPWPEKVRRKKDLEPFIRFGKGIYIPETFRPEDEHDLASDGWPRVIVKHGIRFIRMPGKTWDMGYWDDPNAADRADGPLHAVTTTGFYIQETEATHGQFQDYLTRVDATEPVDWRTLFTDLKANLGEELARKYPAAKVSREGAERFARAMGGQLPTEAQWEFAARSLGERRRYVWGDDPEPNRNLARIAAIEVTPAPVKSYPKPGSDQGMDKTQQGVFDLTGNVQEMCRDGWVSSYTRTRGAVLDPCNPPADPGNAEYVIRGAAYNSLETDCATTRRFKVAAGEVRENLGFRLVVECPDTRKPR